MHQPIQWIFIQASQIERNQWLHMTKWLTQDVWYMAISSKSITGDRPKLVGLYRHLDQIFFVFYFGFTNISFDIWIFNSFCTTIFFFFFYWHQENMSVYYRINTVSLKHFKNIQKFMFYNVRRVSLGRSSAFQRSHIWHKQCTIGNTSW